MSLEEYFRYGENEKRNIFIERKGERLWLRIRGLAGEEIRRIGGSGEREFIEEVIKLGCCEPLIGERETAELLPGELYRIFGCIIKLSGLEKGFLECKEEVKRMLAGGEAEAVYGCIAAFEMGILPKRFCGLDVKERACIGAFIDEKIRLKGKR